MVFAQIKDGIIKNNIVLDDESIIHLFEEGFDYLIQIDNIDPMPAIGWSYNSDDDSFTPTIEYGQADLNTIELWDKYGLNFLQFDQVRNRIKAIVISKAMDAIDLTEVEIPIVCKWIVAPYATRLVVLGDTIDVENWKRLVEETRGYTKESLRGRPRVIEEMRQFIGQYLRREEMSKVEIDDFYFSTAPLLDSFKNTNSPNFWEWLNNDPTTIYADNGFAQKPYYSDEKKDGLNYILNDNY